MRTNPTLLVPGVAGGPRMLLRLQKFLRDSGIAAETAAAPNLRTNSIVRDAELLRRVIREHHSRDPLTIFGYSMGGLIAVLALNDRNAAARVNRVITFGTPFDGVLGWPGKSAMSEVATLISDPARTWRITAVNGRRDLLAPFPQRNVVPNEAITGPYGHLSIISDRGLHELLHGLIRSGG